MLEEVIGLIKPLDADAMAECQVRLDNLTKPLNSLYSFELLAKQMAGITANPQPATLQKSIILMIGDHGIATHEQLDNQDIATPQQVAAICHGNAPVCIFAEHVQANVVLVDVGGAEDLSAWSNVRHAKIAYGTHDISEQAAMSEEEALQAIEVGSAAALGEVAKGAQVIGVGAVGAGSRVAAAAVIGVYSQRPLKEWLSEPLLGKVDEVLQKHAHDKVKPLDVLRSLGGLEMAGLVGVMLGAAAGGAAVVLDNETTSAAAIIAVQLAPAVKDYLIGSHWAAAAMQQEALAVLDVPAYLHLQLGIGEGVGAAMGMSLINASLHVLNDMKTFGDAAVAVAQDGPGAAKQTHAVTTK